MGLVLAVHDNPGSVSPEIGNILGKYDLFGDRSKNTLNEWFYDKLFKYIC